MQTKEVELPNSKATIRRIGAAAKMEYDDLIAIEVPPEVARVVELKEKGDKAEIVTLMNKDATGEIASRLVEFQNRCDSVERKARIFFVCACTVKPAIKPGTIDDVYDVDDFDALEKEVREFNSEPAIPFRKARSA